MAISPAPQSPTQNPAGLSKKTSMARTLAILLRLAWRNLWRNARRTLIMLAAIAVGVWAMIFMTALLRGMVDQMIKTATESFTGHIQLHQRDYRLDPSIVNNMAPPSEALTKALDSAVAWTTRVRVPAVISSERETRGITLMGITPAREAQLSLLAASITSGHYLNSDDENGIIIGAKLADKLDTTLGKRVVIMSQDQHNNIVDRGIRVVGIFHTDLSSVEEQFAFTGLKTVQKYLKLGDQISEIEVKAADYRNVDGLLENIRGATVAEIEVVRWQDLDPYLGATLKMMDGVVLVWMLIVFVTLSFGLVNTLFMAVFERVREIGLMLALGMRPKQILLQIMVEAFFLLVIGLLLGTSAAWLSIKPLESGFDLAGVAQGMEMMGVGSVLYPALKFNDVVLANAIVVVLGLLASALPAWLAARYQPVEAMGKT